MTHRAFTLVELVVVIGVILLLVGLTLSVSVAVIEQSERRETENVLRLLDTAMKEWEVLSDRKLTWWDPYDPPDLKDQTDIHSSTEPILIITEMLDVIGRSAPVKEIIAGIDPDLVYTYRAGTYPPWIDQPLQSEIDGRFDGSLTILDAWETPIYATHPGRPYNPNWDPLYNTPRDPDGTVRTYNEDEYGVARNREVCFVSAGPDQRFGHLKTDPQGAEDNLYSYPITKPDP